MKLVQLVLKDLDEDDIYRIIDRAEAELMLVTEHPFIVHKSGVEAMVLVNQYIESEDDIDTHSAMVAIGRVQNRVANLVGCSTWSVHVLDQIHVNSARSVWVVPGDVEDDESKTFNRLKRTPLESMRDSFSRICKGVNFDVLGTEVEEALWHSFAYSNGWQWRELDKALWPERH